MASLKDIRVRIESTKNTQQITKAMKLVSAAKLRKAQHQIVNLRPYANSLIKVIADVAVTGRVEHPLLKPADQPAKTVLLVVITSDRGLCGAFNTNINKFAENYVKQNKASLEKLDMIFIGRRGLDYFGRRGIKPIESYTRLDKEISFDLAEHIAAKIMKSFTEGEYEEIRLIYNEFKSAISQKVVTERVLPIDTSMTTFQEAINTTHFATDMIFEPEPTQMIEELLKKHFGIQFYRSMCESVAAEHGARMSAMENATNNAKEVLGKLTLTYNKLRQEKITTELTEIVGGAEAV